MNKDQTIINDTISMLKPFIYKESKPESTQESISINIQKEDMKLEEKHIKRSENIKEENNNNNIKKDPMNDSLFECFQLLKDHNKKLSKEERIAYWEKNVASNKGNKSLIEKREKVELIDKFRKNKSVFKGKEKITKLSDVEEELSSLKPKISIKGFISICHIENTTPFTLIYKDSYYDFISLKETMDDEINESDDEMPVVIYNSKEKYWKYELWDMKRLNEFKKRVYKIENVTKPIMAISHYKVDELLEIYYNLGFTEVIKKKQDIYEKLKEYFLELI